MTQKTDVEGMKSKAQKNRISLDATEEATAFAFSPDLCQ